MTPGSLDRGDFLLKSGAQRRILSVPVGSLDIYSYARRCILNILHKDAAKLAKHVDALAPACQ